MAPFSTSATKGIRPEGEKMKKTISLVLILISAFTLFASDTIKIKQKIGGSYNLYLTHNQKSWSSQLTYVSGNKPSLSLGFSPVYTLKKGSLKIKIANYFGFKLDISKNHWPVKEIMNDTFLIPSINKWLLYLRLTTRINRNKDIFLGGREFLEYQISKKYKLRLQTEWSYKNRELISFLGPALEYKITKQLSLTTYLSINTENPDEKFGWVEIKIKFN